MCVLAGHCTNSRTLESERALRPHFLFHTDFQSTCLWAQLPPKTQFCKDVMSSKGTCCDLMLKLWTTSTSNLHGVWPLPRTAMFPLKIQICSAALGRWVQGLGTAGLMLLLLAPSPQQWITQASGATSLANSLSAAPVKRRSEKPMGAGYPINPPVL